MNLRQRSDAEEHMDVGCDDYADYRACLRDLARVNAFTLTHRPMLSWLSREAAGFDAFSVLDVACGYGDALRRIHQWGRGRGKAIALTGLDLNPWAIQAAQEATTDAVPITWHVGDVFAFCPDKPFDFIISAQFAHHLSDDDLIRFMVWMDRSARCGWFIGDLHRHALPYLAFPTLARIAGWHRFVRQDGQISIARGFRHNEWLSLLDRAGVSGQASVAWRIPFRWAVARRCPPL